MRAKEFILEWGHTGDGFEDSRHMDRKRIPAGIAPHESKEHAMMSAGVKTAAILHPNTYKEQFEQDVKDGKFAHLAVRKPGWEDSIHLVALTTEADRLQRMAHLLMSTNSENVTDDYHWELGRLLGYTDEHIQAFLARMDANYPDRHK